MVTRKHRSLTVAALAVLTAAGTTLGACSSSDDDADGATAAAGASGTSAGTASGAAGSSSEAAATSSSASAASSAAAAPASAQAGGDGGQDAGSGGGAPVDPAAALLGAGDAPAGYSVTEAASQDTPPETAQVLDALTFDPPQCKDAMREQLDITSAGGGDGNNVVYSDGAGNTIVVATVAGTAQQRNPDCANFDSSGDLGGMPLHLAAKSSDVPVSVNGADNVRGQQTSVIVGVAGKDNTVSHTSVNGVVNGNSFSVVGTEGVDQAVLASLAQAQADRLKG